MRGKAMERWREEGEERNKREGVYVTHKHLPRYKH